MPKKKKTGIIDGNDATRKENTMAERNIIVGQSGGPTAVINSSLAGVYKTAKERGFHTVYGS